jgi:hypothetical protein
MGQIFQTFEFKVQSIPQISGNEGSYWENIPIASFPPVFDISFPNSTANAVAQAMSNITSSFEGLNNTYQALTQSMQDAACSLDDLFNSLKNAMNFADEFSKQNNQTKVYVRTLGLDPVGTINSPQTFINEMKAALLDAGTEVGQIPKLTPAEIPLNANTIANSLKSGGTAVDQLLGGGGSLNILGIASVSVGLNLPVLSNDDQFQNGFSDYLSLPIDQISISDPGPNTIANPTPQPLPAQAGTVQLDTTSIPNTFANVKVVIAATDVPFSFFEVGKSITISGAQNAANNGTFTISSSSIGMAQVSTQQVESIIITYRNSNVGPGNSETPSPAQAAFASGTPISATERIRLALVAEKKLVVGPNTGTPLINPSGVTGAQAATKPSSKPTIPISELIDILIKHKIIGVNPDKFDQDKQAATERLVQLLAPSSQRIGGFVFVGKAPDLGALVRKVQSLAGIMEWLNPLVQKLITSSLADYQANASGIDFDPTGVQLNKLKSQDNVGVKDYLAAKQKIDKSGLLSKEISPLQIIPASENPDPNNFKAWKAFKPAQLLSGLEVFGTLEDKNAGLESNVQGFTSSVIKGSVGALGDLIDSGKNAITTTLQQLESQTNVIDAIANDMNILNSKMVDSLNWLKNKFGTGPLSMDGHLIGPKLNLMSNAEFIQAVEQAVNDYTDPNRPTFGPPATEDVLQNQVNLNAALQGVPPPTKNTTIWFGLVITIIDKKDELGSQMSTIANLLNMDDSAIEGAASKQKLGFPW